MIVPLGPAATAPTRTAAFVIAHSFATPIGTRSLKTRPRDIGIVPQTPSPRGFFSDQAYVVETGDRAASGAMAEVAANSRSDLVEFQHRGDVNQERISV